MSSTDRPSFRGIAWTTFLWAVLSLVLFGLAIDQFFKPHLAISAVLSQFGLALVALAQVIKTRLGRVERGGQTFANSLMSPRTSHVDRLFAWFALTFTVAGILGVAAGLILLITA